MTKKIPFSLDPLSRKFLDPRMNFTLINFALIVLSFRCINFIFLSFTGIRIKCKGKGHVYWSEGSGDNKRTYSSSEDYINESLVMFGKGIHQVFCFFFATCMY